MNPAQRALSSVLRGIGQSVDAFGRSLEVTPYVDKLQPSLRKIAIKGLQPTIAGSFVAPSASVVGNVTIGANTAIYYGASVRGGGKSQVSIGENSSIGDNSVVIGYGKTMKIGSNVSIGSNAWVADSSIGDAAVIGDNAKVSNAHIEPNGIVAAGAVVPAGSIVLGGTVWAGAPAAFLRNASPAELANLRTVHTENLEMAIMHAGENAKSWERIEADEEKWNDDYQRSDDYHQPLSADEQSRLAGEVEGHDYPGRLFDSPISARASEKDNGRDT